MSEHRIEEVVTSDLDSSSQFRRQSQPALRGASRCRSEGLDRVDLMSGAIVGQLNLVARLEIEPELRINAEVPSEPQRRVGGDGALAVHDLVDPTRGNAVRQ